MGMVSNKNAIVEVLAEPKGSKKKTLKEVDGSAWTSLWKKSYLNGSVDADLVDFEFLEF